MCVRSVFFLIRKRLVTIRCLDLGEIADTNTSPVPVINGSSDSGSGCGSSDSCCSAIGSGSGSDCGSGISGMGCGATGDAVDLTAKLFGIGLREAAVKLAEDFGLNYDSRQKPSVRPRIREPTPEQKYQKGENHCYKVLTDYFHLLREWEKKYAPKQPDEEWNPLFAEALYKKNYIEYLLDILLYGSLEERKALVAEQRKEVLKLEQRIAELSADRTMHSRRNPKQLRAERER